MVNEISEYCGALSKVGCRIEKLLYGTGSYILYYGTSDGNKYILVKVDQITKWVEMFPIRNQLAETLAGVVVRGFMEPLVCPL